MISTLAASVGRTVGYITRLVETVAAPGRLREEPGTVLEYVVSEVDRIGVVHTNNIDVDSVLAMSEIRVAGNCGMLGVRLVYKARPVASEKYSRCLSAGYISTAASNDGAAGFEWINVSLIQPCGHCLERHIFSTLSENPPRRPVDWLTSRRPFHIQNRGPSTRRNSIRVCNT